MVKPEGQSFTLKHEKPGISGIELLRSGNDQVSMPGDSAEAHMVNARQRMMRMQKKRFMDMAPFRFGFT